MNENEILLQKRIEEFTLELVEYFEDMYEDYLIEGGDNYEENLDPVELFIMYGRVPVNLRADVYRSLLIELEGRGIPFNNELAKLGV